MGYFNPITYFIKSFIRLFTRKFFWVLLILILFFLGFLLYDKGVFAETSLDLTDKYYSNLPSSVLDTIKGLEYFNTDFRCFGAYTSVLESFGNFTGFKLIFIPSSVSYSISQVANGYETRLYYTGSGGEGFNHIFYIDNNGSIVRDFYYNSLSYDDSWGFVNSYNTNKYYYIQNMNITYNENNFNYSSSNVHILPSPFVAPNIYNTTADINSFNFETLNINLNSADAPSSTLKTILNVQYNVESENQFSIDISQYFSPSSNTINIPRIEILKNMILSTSFDLKYSLLYVDTGGNVIENYNLGTFNISLSQDSVDNLTALSNQYTQNNIENNTDKTSQSIENINNSLTDSNIDAITSDSLPSDNTTDITSDGVNGIFTSIYNAFCTGDAVDIIFPFPFTNKSITLSPTYVRDNLTNINATFVITLIEAFWWYLISRFIIKDVMNKINKIKAGNVEDIETTNIRGDML